MRFLVRELQILDAYVDRRVLEGTPGSWVGERSKDASKMAIERYSNTTLPDIVNKRMPRDHGVNLSDLPPDFQHAFERFREALSDYRLAANLWIDRSTPDATLEREFNRASERLSQAIEDLDRTSR